MKLWPIAASIVALTASPIVTHVAFAEASELSDTDTRATAEKLFRGGESAYKAGDYQQASAAFEQSYALLPLPPIAFATAQAYRFLYVTSKEPADLQRAITLFRGYVSEQKSGARVGEAIQLLAELEPQMQRLTAAGPIKATPVRAAQTQLMVSSNVEGARGTIDGVGGPLPITVDTAAGNHDIVVEADGYLPSTQQALAVDGQFRLVEVTLVPKPARLAVATEAGANIKVDGRAQGTAPLAAPIRLDPGRHILTITRRGRQPVSRELELTRDQTAEQQIDLQATGQRRAAKWVVIGAGALAIGAASTATLAYLSQSSAQDLDGTPSKSVSQLDDYHNYVQRRDNFVTATWIAGSAAVGLGLVGIAMYFFDHPDESRSQVTPIAVDSGGGIAMTRSF